MKTDQILDYPEPEENEELNELAKVAFVAIIAVASITGILLTKGTSNNQIAICALVSFFACIVVSYSIITNEPSWFRAFLTSLIVTLVMWAMIWWVDEPLKNIANGQLYNLSLAIKTGVLSPLILFLIRRPSRYMD